MEADWSAFVLNKASGWYIRCGNNIIDRMNLKFVKWEMLSALSVKKNASVAHAIPIKRSVIPHDMSASEIA